MYYDIDDKSLDVEVMEHNDTPAMNPKTIPILALDLWEHAYYLDVRPLRKGMIYLCYLPLFCLSTLCPGTAAY